MRAVCHALRAALTFMLCAVRRVGCCLAWLRIENGMLFESRRCTHFLLCVSAPLFRSGPHYIAQSAFQDKCRPAFPDVAQMCCRFRPNFGRIGQLGPMLVDVGPTSAAFGQRLAVSRQSLVGSGPGLVSAPGQLRSDLGEIGPNLGEFGPSLVKDSGHRAARYRASVVLEFCRRRAPMSGHVSPIPGRSCPNLVDI